MSNESCGLCQKESQKKYYNGEYVFLEKNTPAEVGRIKYTLIWQGKAYLCKKCIEQKKAGEREKNKKKRKKSLILFIVLLVISGLFAFVWKNEIWSFTIILALLTFFWFIASLGDFHNYYNEKDLKKAALYDACVNMIRIRYPSYFSAYGALVPTASLKTKSDWKQLQKDSIKLFDPKDF